MLDVALGDHGRGLNSLSRVRGVDLELKQCDMLLSLLPRRHVEAAGSVGRDVHSAGAAGAAAACQHSEVLGVGCHFSRGLATLKQPEALGAEMSIWDAAHAMLRLDLQYTYCSLCISGLVAAWHAPRP